MTPEGDRTALAPWLPRAAGLLALGSTFLLAGGSVWFLSGWLSIGTVAFSLVYSLSFVAVMVHLVAWIVLYRGLRGSSGSMRVRSLLRAYQVSLSAFAVAALTMPFQLFGAFGPGMVLYALFYAFVWPYIPLVFTPVVLFHAYLFSDFALRSQTRLGSRRMALLGAGLLVAISAIGVVGQLAVTAGLYAHPGLVFGTFLGLPAGLTAVGYAFELLAFSSDRGQAAATGKLQQTRGSPGS